MEFLKDKFYILAAILLTLVMGIAFLSFSQEKNNQNVKNQFSFSGSGEKEEQILEEAGSTEKSSSSDWWLNSGAVVKIGPDTFSTNTGKISEDSVWRKAYSKNNPTDTEDGYLPQNIFRLVTRTKWQNFSQEVYFKILATNPTDSPQRNESNGFLFFNRYQDGDNLYYTGIRVDGDAVIKKKIDGKYYTMAETNVFGADQEYDKDKNPNLLPSDRWMGIRSEVENTDSGKVNIKLYFTDKDDSNWKLVLETADKGRDYGKAPFQEKGYAGIRTDFMDVEFRDYHIIEEN